MSPSYDRRRDLVGQNQHRPGDAAFPVSNWANLTLPTSLHMPQELTATCTFMMSASLFDELFLFKEVVEFCYRTHGICFQPKVKVCPENFGECIIQNVQKQNKSQKKIFTNPINKALVTRKGKMWVVVVHLAMCGRMPVLALLCLNQPKLTV